MTTGLTGTEPAIVLTAGVLFLSLVIERLLEILKAIYDVYEAKLDGHVFWNKHAEMLQQQLEELLQNKSVLNLSSKLGYDRLKVEEFAYQQDISISVDAVRKHTIKYVSKILGAVLGITVALLADLDLFALIDSYIYGEALSPSRFETLAQIATGAAIGLGAGPVHKIIAAMEKAKKKRKAKN